MSGWRLSHHFGKILFLAVFAPLLAVIAAPSYYSEPICYRHRGTAH
jgi:hypothetical protein